MRLSAEDLIQLAGCAATAVMEAGVLIAQYDGREVLVQHKAGGESLASQVVTEVDELSQAIILMHLQPTCAAFDLGNRVEL